ncbi:hypothetical protein C5S29_13705 [ANME-1 cluster archaeon GoMg3.2]|nr:hypothetical protein [ANME-1 cluster archaeon GoMg3.2]
MALPVLPTIDLIIIEDLLSSLYVFQPQVLFILSMIQGVGVGGVVVAGVGVGVIDSVGVRGDK